METLIFLTFVGVFLWGLFSYNEGQRSNDLNGTLTKDKEVAKPHFTVTGAKRINKGYLKGKVKYSVQVYFTDKGGRVFFNVFYFYGEAGEYNIGDQLTLRKGT